MNTSHRGLRRRLSRPGPGVAALAVTVMLAAAACGGGDGSDADVAADSATEEAACSPVGEDLAPTATRTISVQLQEYTFAPTAVQVNPGVVTFAATNAGQENHELAFLPGGGEVPLTAEGEPDEDALAKAGAFELEAFGAGQTCNATFDLRPGTYTLFCIVTSPDGQTHYEKDMRGQLVVG